MKLEKNIVFPNGKTGAWYRNRPADRLKLIVQERRFLLPKLLGTFPRKNKSAIPNWLCIGVPKSGTTSLYHALKAHPNIWMPASKETQFFSSVLYYNGLGWYLEKFYRDADPRKAVGELSPKYLIHRKVPRRIRANLGSKVKFIVILRNPIHRAWSHYCHSYQRFRRVAYRPTEDLSFADALNAEPERLVQPDEYSWTHGSWNAYFYTGLYPIHLRHWFKHFPKKNFLVLLFDDLVAEPKRVLSQFFNHIEVKDISEAIDLPKKNSFSRSGMDPRVKGILTERFAPHVRSLERMLDRDLSHWLE